MLDAACPTEVVRVYELLRKYMDSLVGITEMPRERAEKLVQELQKRGEVRARDLQSAAQHILERSSRNRQELVRLVQKEIRRQIAQLGLATRDDVDKLAKRVRTIERASGAKAKKTTRAPAKRASIPSDAPEAKS